ncbi:MAG: glycosyltransferase family 39 protein [Saprospiraceae bacterium]|nr:glycosyltransferase family 39 protein [Saprospiraceae bacterium]MCF8249751.1 glycosyltransferase family 39 protein [Saprospiraceae bacterium]MCF8279236.1 glycosyltransferase family 39 protein [Bacteroidales bacterium]MCF8312784.1 glycosyltransferase family 39 protein [Saprospiraceae bacterium]MCF8441231.1 glycosyltransferase family 39 protein [Saprospiraceae bacterium]
MPRFSKPLVFFLLTGIFYLASLFYYSSWKWAVTGGGDPWGYYVYLPATFLHHDMDSLQRTVAIRKNLHPETVIPTVENPLGISEAHPAGNGRYVVKYTMGVAIFETPFFAAAHAYACVSDRFPADGFSLPYVFAIHLAGIFYALLGLFFLRKTLRRFFSENISLAVLAVLALATNLYYFSVYAGVMAHALLFFLFSLAVYATVRWYETRQIGYALLIGLCCGMVTLVRPTEVVILAIPLFFGIKNKLNIAERLAFLRSNKKQIALAALVFCLSGLPQLLYWKWTSGHFLHYSYGEEGFHFSTPHLTDGLFSYNNGWLAYTPVMWLGLLGLPLLWRHGRDWRWSVALFLPMHIYLVYSWWCWNYINGFGSRPMVEAGVVMAFPLACFFVEMGKQRRWLAWLVGTVVLFFAWLNVFNTWQFSKGLLWTEMGRSAHFWRMLGKTKMDYLDLVVFESGEPQPDSNRLKRSRVLHSDDFENWPATSVTHEQAASGTSALVLNESQKLVAWNAPIGELQLKRGDWLRFSVKGFSVGHPAALEFGTFMSCKFLRSTKSRKSRNIKIESKIGNDPVSIWGGQPGMWGEAYFWVKVPPFLRPDDVLQVGFYNKMGSPTYLDDLSVELWESK